jgi:uncharacterized membrane protein YadS
MAAQNWRTEDWTAVYLGGLIIALVIAAFSWKWIELRNVVPTYRWTTDGQIAARAPAWIGTLDAIAKEAEKRGESGVVTRTNALKEALEKGDRKAIEKAADRLERLGRDTVAGAMGVEIRGHAAADPMAKVFTWNNLSRILYLGLAWLALAAIGIKLIGGRVGAFIAAFPAVFLLAWLSRLLAGNGAFVDFGIEYVVFALLIGLLISNTIGTPEWLKPAVQTEFFIKTGLVILGAGLLFFEIVQAGALGILQAVLVVFVVWYFCFWLCRRLKVDDDFAAVLSSAVAICGVSAAIATCGAINADKKKLAYAAALVLIIAVPMMVAMPWIVKATGMNDIVAGAWIGGTLDTSASVVAAGALISDAAMKTGVIVKFSQNALIGVAAFILVVWWTYKNAGAAGTGERPSAGIIWERFPKFILGFIAASVVFSFFLHIDVVGGTRGALAEFRTWWFALAFVCVGLEARFLDLAGMGQGRPALAFVAAQTVNVFWTLLLAYLLFGGVIFPQPDIR